MSMYFRRNEARRIHSVSSIDMRPFRGGHVDCFASALQGFVRHLLPVNGKARPGYLLPAGARSIFEVYS